MDAPKDSQKTWTLKKKGEFGRNQTLALGILWKSQLGIILLLTILGITEAFPAVCEY